MADKAAAAETVKKVLFTALEALHDYLADIVIIGGWVPQIYAWKEHSPEIPVHSNDVDAAVAARLPIRGDKGVAAVMEEAGFDAETSDSGFALATFGKKPKPVTRFFYRKGKFAVPVEFITPLFGRGEESSVQIQGGLVVPALPAFVLAKGLIFVRRPTIDKKGKDLAYIYETLKNPQWREKIIAGIPATAAKHPNGWYRTFKRNLEEAFATEGSTGPTWTALQYPNRNASELRKEVLQTFQAFLADLK